VCEQQNKELLLLDGGIVLAIVGFDLSLHLPCQPFIGAINNAFPQVAFIFIDGGIHIYIYLQFKPHHSVVVFPLR
jgi:hypothetical protein